MPLQDELLMKKLKEILLQEDRNALQQLQETLNDPVRLSERISPIIEQRLNFIKKNFPAEFRVAVNDIVEQKIRDSQDEILNVIYPTLGKMIRKYISHQFQELKESVDMQIKKMFSTKGFLRHIRNRIFGINESELALSLLNRPIIEEVFVIERDAGLLLGNASLSPTIDRDVVAGMLTAIKAFVEEAFLREREDLELIQYGAYHIVIQNFHSYFMALAISGTFLQTDKQKIAADILDFAEKEAHFISSHPEETAQKELSERLDLCFIAPQRALMIPQN